MISIRFRGDSDIDFRTQRGIMVLAGGGDIINEALKFRKVIEFETSCTVIFFSYIHQNIDRKRSFMNLESS